MYNIYHVWNRDICTMHFMYRKEVYVHVQFTSLEKRKAYTMYFPQRTDVHCTIYFKYRIEMHVQYTS